METKINRDYVKSLLAGLSERTIAFPPVYARITGKMTAGVALAQLVYWWSTKGGQWVHKTDAEVCAETALTADEWVGAKKLLKASGFVSIELRGLPAKSHYFVHIDKITDAIVELQDSGISRNKFVEPKPENQVTGNPLTQIREIPETGFGKSPEHSYIVEITTETTAESTDAPAHRFPAAGKVIEQVQPEIFVIGGESGKEITGADAPKRKQSKKSAETLIADLYTREAYAMAWDWTPFAKAHPHIDGGVVYDKLEAWSSSKGEKKLDWLATGRVWVQKDKSGTEFVRKAPDSVAAQVKMAQAAGHTVTLKQKAAAEWAEMQERNAAKGGPRL